MFLLLILCSSLFCVFENEGGGAESCKGSISVSARTAGFLSIRNLGLGFRDPQAPY